MLCKELDCGLDFITLDFEDGASEECFVAGLYEVEGKKYLSVVVGVNEETDFETDELEGYLYQFVGDNEEEFELLDIDADLLALGGSALFIGQVRGVCAHADDTQSGNDALFTQSIGTLQQLGDQSLVDFLTQ